jgi:RHS repeat-associated protein
MYCGYYFHSRSGLSEAAFRFYSADLGRWICRDPLGEGTGTNLFAYVGNDPIYFVDPSGLKATKSSGAAEIGSAKALMDKLCECCVPAKSVAACKKQAKDVINSLKTKWKNRFSDFPWDSLGDKVGGNYCWDWAAIFEQAVSATPGNKIWVPSNVGMYGGPGSSAGKSKVHHAARIGIKGANQARCSFMLDDGFLNGSMVHPPSNPPWWQGTGYAPDPRVNLPKGAGK